MRLAIALPMSLAENLTALEKNKTLYLHLSITSYIWYIWQYNLMQYESEKSSFKCHCMLHFRLLNLYPAENSTTIADVAQLKRHQRWSVNCKCACAVTTGAVTAHAHLELTLHRWWRLSCATSAIDHNFRRCSHFSDAQNNKIQRRFNTIICYI